MASGIEQLSQRQRELLGDWLPGAEVVNDHSWGLVGTTVLELLYNGARYGVKAGDENDSHLARELRAHREWLGPWTSRGRAPQLVNGDEDAKLIVTRFLPGELVEGSDHEWRPDTYRQAGGGSPRLGTATGSAKRSVLRSGPTGSLTNRSNTKATA